MLSFCAFRERAGLGGKPDCRPRAAFDVDVRPNAAVGREYGPVRVVAVSVSGKCEMRRKRKTASLRNSFVLDGGHDNCAFIWTRESNPDIFPGYFPIDSDNHQRVICYLLTKFASFFERNAPTVGGKTKDFFMSEWILYRLPFIFMWKSGNEASFFAVGTEKIFVDSLRFYDQ